MNNPLQAAIREFIINTQSQDLTSTSTNTSTIVDTKENSEINPKQNDQPETGTKTQTTSTETAETAETAEKTKKLIQQPTTTLPKRFTIYPPLLLLPANTFTIPSTWGNFYNTVLKNNPKLRQILYETIVKRFNSKAAADVSHLAMNAPISLIDAYGNENRMRSPTGLIPLYGDFGPPPVGLHNTNNSDDMPSELDFQRALWVRTVQNHGIVQIWSPLHTMFSRGNITEKTRILIGLSLNHQEEAAAKAPVFEGLDIQSLQGEQIGDISVVDMYAGIGYFVFSYLKRGVKRVWGWEINGWSIEGLRRGCIENGWGCKVVSVSDHGKLDIPIDEFVDSLLDTDRVVVFHGDNAFAADILHGIKCVIEDRGRRWYSIRHVNLGLLPSSRCSWEGACKLIDLYKGGWTHVHENADIHQIDQMKEYIIAELKELRTQAYRACHNHELSLPGKEIVADCRHVEQVKTYAPGVMHCVFDIKLSSLIV